MIMRMQAQLLGPLHSSLCANPLDCDNDLNCDRSKRLNDILAGHDIALLKMVKKVTKQTPLILSDKNLTICSSIGHCHSVAL